MEASAIQAPAALAPRRLAVPAALLRLRSDEQLVALFRAGNDDAFRVIHDRYSQRLLAYTRQMLPGRRQDAEDALQDVFIRAHASLRASDRTITLRAWLYRIAHNRCVDELRRPAPPPPEVLQLARPPAADPIAEAERRESLRRLVEDVRRLPEQQRSALLMRELEGISYGELAAALDVTVPAVKSLLVRARMGLAQAREARDAACPQMREELALAVDRGVRPGGVARRHLHGCEACRAWRSDLQAKRRSLAALAPVGPLALAAKLAGFGGGGAGGAAVATGGGAATGAAAGGGIGLSHIAAVIAAAAVTAGGAIEVDHSLSGSHREHARAAPAATAGSAGALPVLPMLTPAPRSAEKAQQPAGAGAQAPPAPAVAPDAGAEQSQATPDAVVPPADGSGGAAAPADDPGATPDPAELTGTGGAGQSPAAPGNGQAAQPEASGTGTTLPAPPAGAPPDGPAPPPTGPAGP
ncbi:MAG: sigma-70 family RNA polymerase sigma factor [Solirubrobacteraceae bacterium]